MLDQQTVVVVVGAIILYRVIDHAIDYFWKKGTADYVTTLACENCNQKQRGVESQIAAQLSELRGIVLVIAMKAGVNPEDVQRLAK